MNEVEKLTLMLGNVMTYIHLLGGLGGIVLSLILWNNYRTKKELNYKPVIIFRTGLFMSFFGLIMKLILLYVNEIDYYFSSEYSRWDDIKYSLSIIALFVIFIYLLASKKIAFILSNSKYDLKKN